MPLVSGRFRLCSALPSQILESHLQSLPWLLFAFLAGPFRIRSDPCASAGLVSNSARFSSCPSFAIAPPCLSGRIVSPQRHCASSLVSAELIRCHSTQVKSGLITSVANRGCALQIPVSSAPPAPISAVPVRFHPAQCGTSPFHLYSSSILSRRRRAFAPRFCTGRIPAAHRRGSSSRFQAVLRHLHAFPVRSTPCRLGWRRTRGNYQAVFFSASFFSFSAFLRSRTSVALRPSSVRLPPMILPPSSSSSHWNRPLPLLRHWARPRSSP